MADQRGQWNSRTGFIFATVGSAIGLGNIWRFPTAVGQSGGGAFLFLYLVIILFIGIPLMICELIIGRRGKRNIVASFKVIKPGGKWSIIGVIGIVSGFIILSFYSVISGWSLSYIFSFASGRFANISGVEAGNIFSKVVGAPIIPLIWHGIFIALTIGIVTLGIEKGIEKYSKILMPVLFVLLFILAFRSVTLDGAMEGIVWFFKPDFELMSLDIVLGALGQVFFSLSLGMGAVITYGSYLSDNENIPQSSIIISFADLGIAILSGLIIIPAVFAFGLEPDVGPPLIFITLPLVFGSLPMGNIFGTLFFVLLTIAAITSAISLLEVIVAFFVEDIKWSRKKATSIAGIVIFLLGIPSSLSRGLIENILFLGMPFLDFMDFLTSKIFLPIAGLLTAIFVGWIWTPQGGITEIEKEGVSFSSQRYWSFVVKYILPVVLVYILIAGLI